MIKLLFFDYREVETLRGFTRKLERPVKHPGSPLFVADQPWENGNMQLYGSVVKAPGKPFQMWYNCIHRPWHMYLAYAESDDGLVWRRPLFDVFKFNDAPTNIVFTENPHGPAVIYDEKDPREDWRYKMVAGADPSGCICSYRSADGVRWTPVRRFPILGTNPDCPMGFLRAADGRYVIYHRLFTYGRRLFRSESWDFVYWTGEPRMMVEPDAGDPPQIQCYGMGATAYGPYEIGTLWMYHTNPQDLGSSKMLGYQEAEMTYARSGYAWHRAAQGTPFIPHGQPGDWDQGNLQCASAPVFLDDEIRYYYMGTTVGHSRHWELEPQRAGLGLATLKPDRFVALQAPDEPAELLTYAFRLPSPDLFVNALTDSDGWVRLELVEADMKPIAGFSSADCIPISGDSASHAVRWRSQVPTASPLGRPVRL
ncbi:MAG: hypothetical protein FJ279_14500, partial [Planctomycetes bacterium]|nr:hypothetical protein [Planctomycetota bacterium]